MALPLFLQNSAHKNPVTMRTKVLGTVLIVLTVLGGVQLFQNMTYSKHAGDTGEFVVSKVNGRVEGIANRINARLERHDQAGDVSAEVMIEESFKVSQGSDLKVDIAHANVEIITGNNREARITVTLSGRNMDRARDRFNDMEWKVYEEGGDVFVLAEWPRRNWNGNMDIDVLISIPQTFNLDLETSHGDVELGDLIGTVELVTSHGDVDFNDVEGDGVWIKSSHGDISGASMTSQRIDVETSHASIRINEVNARAFSASTSHADISIDYLVGKSSISTSHGDIEVFLAGSEDASFETQHGNIELGLDSSAGADLDLRAPQIRMERDMQVRGENQRERVEGTLNGGGRLIRARTTHGVIDLNDK